MRNEVNAITVLSSTEEVAHTGRFGRYGGSFVPEPLVLPLETLAEAFREAQRDPVFQGELASLLENYAGRPTPLTEVPRYAAELGRCRIFLKREDLLHTGAHKLNNALGQALLARRMGKAHLVAETGAGQHGVATATVAARFGMQCTIFMGAVDAERQALNVFRMRMLGAEVVEVREGSATLRDAVDAALMFYAQNAEACFYLLGSAVGPHPYPYMVREFQKVIGIEARRQVQEHTGRLPTAVLACVGGGSNAMGAFHAFVPDREVRLIGVEGGGQGPEPGRHAARFAAGRQGVIHGMETVALFDERGGLLPTHSVSAGMDYPGVGPEHAFLRESGRAEYLAAQDEEALAEFHRLARFEGILPALESAHALAGAARLASGLEADDLLVVNLSGRGDKDVAQVAGGTLKQTPRAHCEAGFI